MPPSETPPTWPNLTVTGFGVAVAVALAAAGALDAGAVGAPPPHAPPTNGIAKAAASLCILFPCRGALTRLGAPAPAPCNPPFSAGENAAMLGAGRRGGERRGVLAPARAA